MAEIIIKTQTSNAVVFLQHLIRSKFYSLTVLNLYPIFKCTYRVLKLLQILLIVTSLHPFLHQPFQVSAASLPICSQFTISLGYRTPFSNVMQTQSATIDISYVEIQSRKNLSKACLSKNFLSTMAAKCFGEHS